MKEKFNSGHTSIKFSLEPNFLADHFVVELKT
jgi:hypothetical protein